MSIVRYRSQLVVAGACLEIACSSSEGAMPASSEDICPAVDGQLGCYTCDDGWHTGADGECHVDCPATLEQDEDGACRVPVCGAGASQLSWTDESSVLWTSCVAACPPGMVAGGSGLERSCHIPCTGEWTEADGACHRVCPAGMTASASSSVCELDAVGERKACPSSRYDDAIPGPNPLYVDASSSSPNPDGSVAAPFATVADALAAAGDEVTIHLAAGTYHERVYSAGRSSVSIVGVCATRVHIIADDLEESAAVIPAAVELIGATTATVRGVSVSSNLRGIRTDCTADKDAVVTIADNRIERAGYSGISTRGGCSVEVRDNTVLHAQAASILLTDTNVTNPSLRIRVLGNDILDMDPCVSSAACIPLEVGLAAYDLESAVVSANRVQQLEAGTGIYLDNVATTAVHDNVVRQINGDKAIFVAPAPGGAADIRRNIVTEGAPAPTTDNGRTSFYGIDVYRPQPSSAVIDSNVVADVRGAGIAVAGAGEADLLGNEVRQALVGLWLEGASRVEDNRVQGTRLPLAALNAQRIEVRGNVLGSTVDTDFGLLPGSALTFFEDETSNIGLTVSGPAPAIALERNEIAGCLGPNAAVLVSAQSIAGSASVLVRDNEFRSNAGINLYIEGNPHTEVSGNRFVGEDSAAPPSPSEPARVGLMIAEGAAGSPTDVTVDNNYFQDFPWGRGLYLSSDRPLEDAKWTVDDNSFVNAGISRIRAGALGARVVSSRRNHLALTLLFVDSVQQVAFEQNALFLSRVVIGGLPASGQMSIRDNVAFMGQLALVGSEAPGSIMNNEVRQAQGFGVAVASCTGPVRLLHNLVQDTQLLSVDGVGEVGDGIHITGAAELGASEVEVSGNLVSGSARLGLLLSGSSGVVDNNAFVRNGCGRECQFAVQSPSGAVTGRDAAWVSTPERPYAAITAEDL